MKTLIVKKYANKHLGSTRIYVENLSTWWGELGYDISVSTEIHSGYDLVLFSKDVPMQEAYAYCVENENTIVGKIHPKAEEIVALDQSSLRLNNRLFAIVGSIVEQDFMRDYFKHIFILPQIESYPSKIKTHEKQETITIGYHGNRYHLENLPSNLVKALEELSRSQNIVFHALYNIEKVGRWKRNRPNISICDIQWNLESIESELLQCDIGICPGLIEVSSREKSLLFLLQRLKNISTARGAYSSDLVQRFKNTCNSGRAFVFHQLGIPVVADFSPTNFAILGDPDCGFLANSTEGWKHALETLSCSETLRNSIAQKAKRRFEEVYNPHHLARRLHESILALHNARV